MYAPKIREDLIRPLYRLARVRRRPMTTVINAWVEHHLAEAAAEIDLYRPALHDRHRHRRKRDQKAA